MILQVFVFVFYIKKLIRHGHNKTLHKYLYPYNAKYLQIQNLAFIRSKQLSKNLTIFFICVEKVQLTYDLISTLVLFFIIFLFNYFNTRSKKLNPKKGKIENLDLFVKRKKTIGLFLLPVLIFLAVSSLFKWIYIEVASIDQVFFSIQDINELFFNEFFRFRFITQP